MVTQKAEVRKSITVTEQERRLENLGLEMSNFPRIERLRRANVEAEFRIISERAKIYTEVFKETEGEPQSIRFAKALARTLREMKIDIEDDELLVGHCSAKRKTVQAYPEIWHRSFYEELGDIGTREDSATKVSKEDAGVFWNEVYPYWKETNAAQRLINFLPDEMANYWLMDPKAKRLVETAVPGTFNMQSTLTDGQVHMDLEHVLKRGVEGIKNYALEMMKKGYEEEVLGGKEDPDYMERYQVRRAMVIVYGAACDFIKRYASLAKEKAEAEKNPKRKEELTRISKVCYRISENPPGTFWEALQLLLFVQNIAKLEAVDNQSCAFGGWDQYLYPFYKRDLEEGRLTAAEAQELIDCFFIKVADYFVPRPEVGQLMNSGFATWHTLCISGLKPDGSDATNELSWMALQAVIDCRLFQPDVSLLYHKNIPDDFLKRACEVASLGTGHPKFYSHDAHVAQVMAFGRGEIPIEEARTVTQMGCTESAILKKRITPNSVPMTNIAGVLEFALNNGKGRLVERQFGPKTGDPRKFKSFDEFVNAFKKQLEHAARLFAAICSAKRASTNKWLYIPFESATREISIEKGTDYIADVDKNKNDNPYGWWFWPMAGYADCAEAFHVIDELVFKRKRLTMDELINALDNNFEGEHERILRIIENEITHYGNDDRSADRYAEMVSKIISETCAKYCLSSTGQPNAPDLLSVTINVAFGMVTGALPSGKQARMPVADASGPFYGYDKNGPTACVRSVGRSCCKVSHEIGIPNQNLFNVRLQPEMVLTEGGIDNWVALVKTYFDAGGTHIQFNVVSTETLKDAQENPEKYLDLLVRVAGYSAYFVTLGRVVQDDIIHRTEYSRW